MPTTTSYSRGTVVLLPFPFSDLSGAKLRPAVIVSPPYPSDDLLVAAVTSVGDALRPGEFAIRSWRQAACCIPRLQSALWRQYRATWHTNLSVISREKTWPDWMRHSGCGSG